MTARKINESVPDLIPLEDLNIISDDSEASDAEEPRIHPDTVPMQKLIINNKDALERIYKSITTSKYAWIDTQVITADEVAEVKDVHDDLEKETLFYNQALQAVEAGKKKVAAAGIPFSRPDDYFAEMVKSDEHMTKIRQKLLDESKSIEASQNARKQRELKKMGKKIQFEKLKEREDQKRQTKESINNLKRKLKDQEFDDDEFEVDLEDALDDSSKGKSKRGDQKKRIKKDAKFGFGGKKRGSKRNTKESTHAEDDGYSVKKNKQPGFNSTTKKFNGKAGKAGKAARPGKSKRMTRRGKK